MSGILKRTVYMKQERDGRLEPTGWAKVETSVGSAYEPFFMDFGTTLRTPGDEMNRVDEIKILKNGQEQQGMGSGDGIALIGGQLVASA